MPTTPPTPPPTTPGPGSVKLSAKLPKTNPLNGLGAIHSQLAGYGGGYVIMFVESDEQVARLGGGRQPLAVVEHIEGLPTGPLADAGKELLLRARKARELSDGVLPGMDTDGLAGKHGDEAAPELREFETPEEPYVEGPDGGDSWNH